MKKFEDILHGLDGSRDQAYSFIRIFLGTALFVRGVILFSDPAVITELARVDNFYWWFSYITIAHLIGGICLALGLMTRFAALLQIPILVGAVFYVHLEQGLLTVGQSLELAVLVLVLLIIYFVYGSGILSLDAYMAGRKTVKA